MVAERLLNSYRSLNREADGIALLREYLSKYHSLDLMNVVFAGVLKNEGSAAAYQLVHDELERNPTLLGLDKLLEARLLEVPVDMRADVEMVKDLVHKRTRNLASITARIAASRPASSTGIARPARPGAAIRRAAAKKPECRYERPKDHCRSGLSRLPRLHWRWPINWSLPCVV